MSQNHDAVRSVVVDYSEITVKMPKIVYEIDEALNDKRWDDADRLAVSLANYSNLLRHWIAEKKILDERMATDGKVGIQRTSPR